MAEVQPLQILLDAGAAVVTAPYCCVSHDDNVSIPTQMSSFPISLLLTHSLTVPSGQPPFYPGVNCREVREAGTPLRSQETWTLNRFNEVLEENGLSSPIGSGNGNGNGNGNGVGNGNRNGGSGYPNGRVNRNGL